MHSQSLPFFLTPRLGELINKNNSTRLGANSCWFGRCSGVIGEVGEELEDSWVVDVIHKSMLASLPSPNQDQ